MIILAIETSCDDTCAAIVKTNGRRFDILSNIISSQVKIHQKYGGVYPFFAKREHQKNLPLVFKKAQKEAKNPSFDLIAVTSGPGLEPCLWVGINFAKTLAEKLKIPLIPVNHVEAHIFSNFISEENQIDIKKFEKKLPAVCLVVSGGHTQLILMRNFGEYEILGETRDDAAGECFDKTARILGLGYPGGPKISEEAKKFKNKKSLIKLPRPMIYQKNHDFSFSGLKTAVLYDFKNRPEAIKKSREYLQNMAFEIQQAIIDVLISKTIKAAKEYRAKSVILGGGVVSNDELREQFEKICKKEKMSCIVPEKKLCTDNAVMVATVGFFNFSKGKKIKEIMADSNLKISN